MQVHVAKSLLAFFLIFFSLVENSFTIFPPFRDSKRGDVRYGFWQAPLILMIKTRPVIQRGGGGGGSLEKN